ncbi:unnamed protein product [Diamesa serratosioi]
MRLIGNKNTQINVELMEWSHKMDLIALANDAGEVIVQRLKWQKDFPLKLVAPEEGLLVRSIAWRMDEKILGIAYSNGLIMLIDIEIKEEIHSFKVDKDIKSICWTQNAVEIDEAEKCILDSHKTYLANLANVNSMASNMKKQDYKSEKFYSRNMLNFLLVALDECLINIYIFGVLSCGQIDLKLDIKATPEDQLELIDVKLSGNFKQLLVVYEKNKQIELVIYENNTLLKFHVPLWKISVKYGQVLNILGYIDDTIQYIVEAWESVLLEMDNKLTKYAKTQPKGSVSADFLELLMFGYPSEALDQFLTRELTEKELKQLGNSIELSYSTIQKLVVKSLHNAIINLFYHINYIMGMQQNTFYYKDLLGTVSKKALKNTGAFLIKSYELQQTIDTSMRDYKIFFRWLYVAIMRLSDETIPEDVATVTQQEINYLADFLNNFEQNAEESVNSDSGEVETKFNLERVGQYLVDKNLIIPVKPDENSLWESLLMENECLKNSPAVYPHHKELSLVQQKNLLRKSIDVLFGKLEHTVGSNFNLQLIKRFDNVVKKDEIKKVLSSHINVVADEDNPVSCSMFTILTSSNNLLFVVCSLDSEIRSIELTFNDHSSCSVSSIGELSFIDVKFYNKNLISLLLLNKIDNKSDTCFMQMHVGGLLEILKNTTSNHTILNAYSLIDEMALKTLEGMTGVSMAVSGSRKVASFLASNLKVLRLYELEVEEDENDDYDVSNNVSFENC